MPCFNMATHVEQCVKSIYGQTVNWDFEIIAVNDASTDNTHQVLQRLSSQFPALRIINHEQNCKLSGARTTGIKHARGEYIMHVDPDDYLIPHSLDDIFEKNSNDWDILITNIYLDYGNGRHKLRYNLQQTRFDMRRHRDSKIVFDCIAKGACVGKFFRRELLKDMIYFNYHYNIGEDRAFNIEAFSKAKHISYDHRSVYFYQLVSTSLTHTGFNKSIIEWENCWAHNVINLYQLNELSKEAQTAASKELERNSIGHLLRIRKERNRNELYTVWKDFITPQLCLFKRKRHWYSWLLKKPLNVWTEMLFLATAADLESFKDQIRKLNKNDR